MNGGTGNTNCGGSPCDICFKNQPGTGDAVCDQSVNVYQEYFAEPQGLSHEFGHFKYCVGDEYYVNAEGITRYQCGHSNMANAFGNQNNFCVDFDHKKDKYPDAGASTSPSVMHQAYQYGRAINTQNVTFDNFDYETFD